MKPPAPDSAPPYLKPISGGVRIHAKIQPRASRNEIGEVLGNELKIKVTAPPVDSAANEAVVDFIAEKLRCPSNAVRLVRGHTSRHKVIEVSGVSWPELVARLR